MPLQLPNLDDRRYKDLVAEALTLIPTYCPTWTNHNPSDPGITLVEVFAYLTEMLVYRMNRVTNHNTLAFLKLLNGPEWTPPTAGDLLDEIQLAVLGVRERFRAVTAEDYEYLSTVSFNESLRQSAGTIDPIARAHCVPQRNLEAGSEADRLKLRPEHVSVVIVPFRTSSGDGASGQSPQPAAEQIEALFAYLDERRILTTKLHVTGPFYTHVSVQLVIARHQDVLDTVLAAAINENLATLLNPLPSDGRAGWPFGRDVYVSEIYETLEKIPGIDFVTDVMLTSKCSPTDTRCVVADPIWHSGGDLIGLKLEDHHLPVFDQAQLTIAADSRFITVTLTVSAKTASSADLALVSRSIKSTVRSLLHPALGGPGPGAGHAIDIFLRDVQVAIGTIPGIVGPVLVTAYCAPAQTLQQDQNRGPFLHVADGDVLDWRVTLQLS